MRIEHGSQPRRNRRKHLALATILSTAAVSCGTGPIGASDLEGAVGAAPASRVVEAPAPSSGIGAPTVVGAGDVVGHDDGAAQLISHRGGRRGIRWWWYWCTRVLDPDQGATEPTSPPPTPTTEAPTPTSEAPAPPTTPTNPTPTTNPTPPTSPTPTTDPAEQTPASVADPEVTAAGLNEAEVASLAALSAERAKVGLAALRPDAQLSAYARGWAQEMRNSGFRHSSNQALLGLMSGTRSSVGENIAWHSDASMTPEQAAATFQEMWRNSPGHYANQVNTAWTEAGIGLYLDSSGWWAVHVFSNGTRAV